MPVTCEWCCSANTSDMSYNTNQVSTYIRLCMGTYIHTYLCTYVRAYVHEGRDVFIDGDDGVHGFGLLEGTLQHHHRLNYLEDLCLAK